jgi:hypothetical protein
MENFTQSMILDQQPRTFVIALENHEVSRQQLQDCIDSANTFNWSIEIFWGTDGRTLTEDSWKELGITPLLHKAGKKGGMDRRGTWGCFFSHYKLWNKCIDLQEPIVILEHDAIINQTWQPVNLDSLTKLHENYTIKFAHKLVDQDSGFSSSSTHAYCLSTGQASKLVNFSKSVGAFATDRMIGDKVLPYKHTTPSIVDRQNTFSTTGFLE